MRYVSVSLLNFCVPHKHECLISVDGLLSFSYLLALG